MFLASASKILSVIYSAVEQDDVRLVFSDIIKVILISVFSSTSGAETRNLSVPSRYPKRERWAEAAFSKCSLMNVTLRLRPSSKVSFKACYETAAGFEEEKREVGSSGTQEGGV